jgi:hypothetical protein
MEIRVAMEETLSRYPEFDVHPERAVRHVVSNVRGVATLPFAPHGFGGPARA